MEKDDIRQSRWKGLVAKQVYIVLRHDCSVNPGSPNVKVIAAKFTRAAAQAVVDTMPGTYVEKVFADKHPGITPL